MDLGRAKFRQAHKLPPEKADHFVLGVAICVLAALAFLAVLTYLNAEVALTLVAVAATATFLWAVVSGPAA